MLAQSANRRPANRRYRALIADDDSRSRDSLASLLKVEGFQTVPVGGGMAVLDLLLEQLNRQLLQLDQILARAEEQQLEEVPESLAHEVSSEEIDLLVLDYNMPDLTGLEVLAKLRKEFDQRITVRIKKTVAKKSSSELPLGDSSLKGPLVPPAIVVSGEASTELEQQVMNVGGFALVPKPIHPTHFREQIWKLVRSMLCD